MLTDIFSDRYRGIVLWNEVGDRDKKFLVQAFRIIEEQLYPYWVDGRENLANKKKWDDLNKRLSMELGMPDLSSRTFGYKSQLNGNSNFLVNFYPTIDICKNFLLVQYDASIPADQFMKDRMSFVELAFRQRYEEIVLDNQNLPAERERSKQGIEALRRSLSLPGNPGDGVVAWNKTKNDLFAQAVEELNARLRQAGYPLNYHNGFIQISNDFLGQELNEKPFWSLVSNPIWRNVDIDMKQSIDVRDGTNGDAAFYAARALESAVKIISDKKGWTHGGEKGAQNYLDNLGSKKNGFIDEWEKKSLEEFFRTIRNPFGHGAGSAEMPKLTTQQTDWAIGFCMIWIRSLIQRM